MEIFGWFFPVEIINWCCDDWYNTVYKPNYFFPLCNHYCSNDGGAPRYDINNDRKFKGMFGANVQKLRQLRHTALLAEEHKKILFNYLSCSSMMYD